MPHFLNNPYCPAYAFALLFVVFIVAWILSYIVPFFRRELLIEDRSRLTPLDGLRGILAFAVLCHHAGYTYGALGTDEWPKPLSRTLTLMGESSVGVFFCITAFLFWSRAVKLRGNIPAWPFLRGRLFRIAPAYLFGSLMAIAFLFRKINWHSVASYRGMAKMGLAGFVQWGMIGPIDVSIVDARVTWSLPYEWGFYLMLIALATLVQKDSRRIWLFAAGAMVMFPKDPATFFLPGILAVYASRNESIVRYAKSFQASLMIIAVVALLPHFTDLGYSAAGFIATTLVFVPIACGNTVFGFLTLRGLRLMGLISYSVYLLHAIILYAARPFLLQTKHAGGGEPWIYWGYVTVIACGTLIFCSLTYRFIEWPFIQYEKSLRRSPTTNELATAVATPTLPAAEIEAGDAAFSAA